MKFETDIYSDKGGREVNEDSVNVCESEDGGFIAVLADGVGAHGGGDIASRIVVEKLSETSDRSDILSLYNGVNEAVLAAQKPGIYMKSTAVMIEISESEGITTARISNVGDSRCYMFRKNKIIFQTSDHSFPGLDLLRGKITASEIRFHPGRNKLLRAIGSDNATPEVTQIEVKKGDAFLLCSDGFWEYVDEKEMAKSLRKSRRPQDWIPSMLTIMKKRFPPDHDNCSAVAVRVM
ncbi:MAG: protein phosphatase 2C domain-containing protein [Ruminococcus sp.]|jgi:serine/threonine protein phosphatase PrpC|nr:protein phosphatase 2C domain-containing protein [Ruminococcus sp.]